VQDDNEDESRLWLELTMESIQRGVAASLTALHILTSQNMPKRAYIEDLIDRIVHFTKFQLQNTIYPTFDPVYRVDPRGKGTTCNSFYFSQGWVDSNQ
jgi:cohesin loading factor subunit SCC2